ncbi:hypothetical protein [Streptomyces sp. NRRL S-350]|uniref:hypothetical protein n=1 Tax=Streptomyces sp. NRRL S-350 TaxID=1463902 RepID=UPI00131B056F|nr:hypothetical protein [Streptomyces sp. NRRL S-350]
MLQRTRWNAHRRNSGRPMSRGCMPRPASTGPLPQIFLRSGMVRPAGFTRVCIAPSKGLIRSGVAVLRIVRSRLSAEITSGERLGLEVEMT